jgi:hypothetical protein
MTDSCIYGTSLLYGCAVYRTPVQQAGMLDDIDQVMNDEDIEP